MDKQKKKPQFRQTARAKAELGPKATQRQIIERIGQNMAYDKRESEIVEEVRQAIERENDPDD